MKKQLEAYGKRLYVCNQTEVSVTDMKISDMKKLKHMRSFLHWDRKRAEGELKWLTKMLADVDEAIKSI